MKLMRNDPAIPGQKYLVVRRDGSVPRWPYFVLAASDRASAHALRAYANNFNYLDPEYANNILDLANEFDAWRNANGARNPVGGRSPSAEYAHPQIILAMEGHRATITVWPDNGTPATAIGADLDKAWPDLPRYPGESDINYRARGLSFDALDAPGDKVEEKPAPAPPGFINLTHLIRCGFRVEGVTDLGRMGVRGRVVPKDLPEDAAPVREGDVLDNGYIMVEHPFDPSRQAMSGGGVIYIIRAYVPAAEHFGWIPTGDCGPRVRHAKATPDLVAVSKDMNTRVAPVAPPALPPSLTQTPNIPWEKQSLEQLMAELDYWDIQISRASGFATAKVADDFRKGCEAWMIKRRGEFLRA